ncbi:MAG TPA: ATP synthase subunit I [Trichocoleus sp.]
MTVSRTPLDEEPDGQNSASDIAQTLPQASDSAMAEYRQLEQNLLVWTLIFTGFIFFFVWGFYSLHIALNYLIGACTGVVYLKMLAKNVAELGREKKKLGTGRLALFILLIVGATQWQQLEVLPVFLGFLTYKAAVIAFTLWTSVLPK